MTAAPGLLQKALFALSWRPDEQVEPVAIEHVLELDFAAEQDGDPMETVLNEIWSAPGVDP